MRRTVLLATVLPLLAGCDQYSGGPLPHALAALRAGDYEDYLAAKKESDEEIAGAIHADDDLCLAGPRDFTKYRSQYSIHRLDHKELFALPEEERFLYAIKIAGPPSLEPGHFLERAPIVRMTSGTSSEDAPLCQGKQEKMAAALSSDGGYSIEVDEGRLRLLKDWLTAMNFKHGEKIDEKMHAAVAHLDAQGYSAKWPAAID